MAHKGEKMKNLLLLTGTINPDVYGNVKTHPSMRDPGMRLRQYEQSVEKWISFSEFDHIVFAENSGSSFDTKRFEGMAEHNGKKFEFLRGGTYAEEVKRFGKSYGEIRLINDAVDNSALLRDADAFYKCTGRLFIRNVNSILHEKSKTGNKFIVNMYDPWVISWFFKVDKLFYNTILRDAFNLVDDSRKLDIETIYYRSLLPYKKEISGFKNYPEVQGKIGGSGTPYNIERWRLITNTIRMRFFSKVFVLR